MTAQPPVPIASPEQPAGGALLPRGSALDLQRLGGDLAAAREPVTHELRRASLVGDLVLGGLLALPLLLMDAAGIGGWLLLVLSAGILLMAIARACLLVARAVIVRRAGELAPATRLGLARMLAMLGGTVTATVAYAVLAAAGLALWVAPAMPLVRWVTALAAVAGVALLIPHRLRPEPTPD